MQAERLGGPALATLLLAAMVAGCLGGAEPAESPVPGPERLDWMALGASIYQPRHDHWDRSLHEDIAVGLTVTAASTLAPHGEPGFATYTEADLARGLIAVAAANRDRSQLHVRLLDAAALPELRIMGGFTDEGPYGDVKLDRSEPLAYVPYPLGRAFAIWDIEDPAAPVRLGDVAGGGCHMLHPATYDGEPHVWCATAGGTSLYRIERPAPGRAVGVPLGMAVIQSDPEVARYADYYGTLGPALVTTPHDMTAQDDPLTGEPILVVANELQGIRVFEPGPGAPREIAHWRGEGLAQPMERLHTAALFDLDGRRVAVASSETFTNRTPTLYIVDFTDWNAPQLLAAWTPPGIPVDDLLAYSLHNFQIVGTRLYLAAFHAGLWVLDLSEPEQPEVVALRVPVRASAGPEAGGINQFWDVIVAGGWVIVTDMAAGIEVLHVDGDPIEEGRNGFL